MVIRVRPENENLTIPNIRLRVNPAGFGKAPVRTISATDISAGTL
jgi:hypothetical protein